MNEDWSRYVQGPKTLYLSRRLRFDDRFRSQYEALFALDREAPLRILEIGCGPGALCEALHRWYPRAQITGVDRDSGFIRFAREQAAGVTFLEGDAAALPFPDGSFDVTISNTVSEHIEPGVFYAQQRRVLREGGVCLVLSSRRGIQHTAACMEPTPGEQRFWEKAMEKDDTFERFAVGRYQMNEQQLPAAMEAHGFEQVSTGYVIAPLTPDDPAWPRETAREMIDAQRWNDLESVDSVMASQPDRFTQEEAEAMRQSIHRRCDGRIALLERGEKQWDASVSVIMGIRGVKGKG